MLVAATGRADQVQVLEQPEAGMAPRIAAANLASLLDHRPDRGDEVEVARSPVVALEPPGNQRGLVDRRRLPFGNAVDRVFLKPVQERPVPQPHLVEPLVHTATDLGGAPAARARRSTQIASLGQQYALSPRSKPEATAPVSASACIAAASAERRR